MKKFGVIEYLRFSKKAQSAPFSCCRYIFLVRKIHIRVPRIIADYKHADGNFRCLLVGGIDAV